MILAADAGWKTARALAAPTLALGDFDTAPSPKGRTPPSGGKGRHRHFCRAQSAGDGCSEVLILAALAVTDHTLANICTCCF
ncbi:MAG: hypothetical protein ACLRRT_07415 [Ruthenibacterium lactatiformans]